MGLSDRLYKLEKLKIHVFGNRLRAGLPQKTFEVMFNPETYSLQYENKFQGLQGINTSSRKAVYSLSKPQNLSLKLIFDNTGVSQYTASRLFSKSRDVYKQVQEFLDLTFHMDGDIHEPKFLRIEWGDLIFNCRLASVDIKYSMFNRKGQPVRSELDAKFIGDIEDSKRVKKENKSSPDLTHTRVVKSGDTLPLLSKRMYGDPSYYIKIAQANNLNNFRNLKPGMTLIFPPIKK